MSHGAPSGGLPRGRVHLPPALTQEPLYHIMLYYSIYYTILYYTILYYTILYYTILYCTVLYYTILYYLSLSIHIYIYIYTHIHTYTHTHAYVLCMIIFPLLRMPAERIARGLLSPRSTADARNKEYANQEYLGQTLENGANVHLFTLRKPTSSK